MVRGASDLILFYCFCYTSGIGENSNTHIWKQEKENEFQYCIQAYFILQGEIQ